MEIKNAFYLTGFTRIDKGEQGAVFVRYDEPSERKGKPSINESYLNYGGKGSESFILSMPARNVISAAIVTRTSKNRYSATVFGVRSISSFCADSLDGLRNIVATFFADEDKTLSKNGFQAVSESA